MSQQTAHSIILNHCPLSLNTKKSVARPTEKIPFRQGCYRAPGQELCTMCMYLHSYDETFHHFSILSLITVDY